MPEQDPVENAQEVVDPPIMVNPSALPDQTMVAIRVILIFFGGIAVQRGWMSNEEMLSLVGALLVIGPTIWAILSARKNKAEKVVMADALPNYIAQVKR